MKKLFLIFTLLICSVTYGQRCVGNCTNGQGTYTLQSGTKYVGSWKDGKRSGQGTNTWPSGWKYVGSWKDDKRHGQGTYFSPDGTVKEGIWENGKYIGTQAQVQAKERERIARENRERQAQKEAKMKYDRIHNACLLDKSSGVDMQVSSLRRAVEETCKSIANDPSWYDELKYFKL